MKIITLNTHSLLEENQDTKLMHLADFIENNRPSLIALQEVNQTSSLEHVENTEECKAIGKIPLKSDNYAFRLSKLLKSKGVQYNCIWYGFKNSYGRFDEGLAILSEDKPLKYNSLIVSQNDSYTNWKTRGALWIQIENVVFCTTHLGWWHDKEEPFEKQFAKLHNALSPFEDVILMGDFNSPDNIKNEGYSFILSNGWNDLYKLAEKRQGFSTASGKIAGWEETDENKSLRIDYIFSKRKIDVKNHYTVFDGIRGNIISDHFGVAAQFQEVEYEKIRNSYARYKSSIGVWNRLF